MEKYLLSLGLKVWEKDNNKRIYINDLSMFDLSKYTPNPTMMRKVSMYYDVNNDKFVVFNSTSSRESTVNAIIEDLRKQAN